MALDVASPAILEEDQASPLQPQHDQSNSRKDDPNEAEELIHVRETEIAPELTVLGEDTVADILLNMEQEEKKEEELNELDKTTMMKQSIKEVQDEEDTGRR